MDQQHYPAQATAKPSAPCIFMQRLLLAKNQNKNILLFTFLKIDYTRINHRIVLKVVCPDKCLGLLLVIICPLVIQRKIKPVFRRHFYPRFSSLPCMHMAQQRHKWMCVFKRQPYHLWQVPLSFRTHQFQPCSHEVSLYGSRVYAFKQCVSATHTGVKIQS